MTDNSERTYPRTVHLQDEALEVRYLLPSDEAAVSTFAGRLPPHDLLFMRRDITAPKVMAAWLQGIENGTVTTLLATQGDSVRGCAAIIRDDMSWSPHVGEIRLVVDHPIRGKGLGRALALGLGIEKLIAYMTVDQQGAIAVFEELGFHAEALLREHVQDRNGARYDVVMLSHDVNKFLARMEVFGMNEAQ